MTINEHKFLILGSNGQLGKEFRKELTHRGLNFSAPEEKVCDITDFRGIEKTIGDLSPTIIVNCAAYNAVEEAESKSELANLINHEAIDNVARICERHRIFLVHYSTDYVFDGTKGDLYNENDKPNPVNTYGKSKLAGELAVREALSDCLVFRPSWVYGDGTQNFIHKLQGWASKNNILKLSNDEISVPTSAHDMVKFTLSAVEKELKGLFHLTNSGYASRYEWGLAVIEQLKLNNTVIPVPMSTFPSLVRRPRFTAMSNKLLQENLGVEIPHWKSALEYFLLQKTQSGP